MVTLNIRLPTTGDSSSSSQHKTVEIPNLGEIKNITVDTGKVTYELLGNNQVKINASGGTYVRRSYSSRKYSKYVSRETSPNYNSGGYSGTLTRYLYSGSYTPSKSKGVGQAESYRRTNPQSPKKAKEALLRELNNNPTIPYADADGYSGTLTFDHVFDEKSRSEYDGYVYYCRALFNGTVTKPAVDTRVYRYCGTVYCGGYNYYYAYNVTIEYEEDSQTYLKVDGKYKKVHIYLKANGIYVAVSPYLKIGKRYKKV